MTDPALIERITRSLAFMLRHQPETFDLELDPYGFADLEDVVHALNERLGEPVEEEDVQEAVRSGDRQRYEIQDTRIRALYGHSIPVEPGPSSKPPELLYVAVPETEVERARRFGLRGGRRRFLHLAITKDDAAESGRRASRDYTVLVIRALDAWEEGISFYDRIALWLAEEVPTHLIEIEGTYHDGTDPLPRQHDGPRARGPREHEHQHGRSRGGRGRGREQGEWRGDRGQRGDRGDRGQRGGERRPAQGDARPPFASEPSRASERPERSFGDEDRGQRSRARPEPDVREQPSERPRGSDGFEPRRPERYEPAREGARAERPSDADRGGERGPAREPDRGPERGPERGERFGRNERGERTERGERFGGERTDRGERGAPREGQRDERREPETRRDPRPPEGGGRRDERRPERAPERERARDERPARPPQAPRPPAVARPGSDERDPSGGFGAGLEAKEEREPQRPAPAPRPERPPPRPARQPEPPSDDRPGFGAGL